MLNKMNGNEQVLEVIKNLLDFSGKVMFDSASVVFLVEQVILYYCYSSPSSYFQAKQSSLACSCYSI